MVARRGGEGHSTGTGMVLWGGVGRVGVDVGVGAPGEVMPLGW